MFPVPGDHQRHARPSPGHRSPRSQNPVPPDVPRFPLSTLDKIPTPPTPVSRGRGGTEAGHRTRTPVMPGVPSEFAQRRVVPPEPDCGRLRVPSVEGLGCTARPGWLGWLFCRARNRASRATSAIRINSANRCFCNAVSTSSTSSRSCDRNSSSCRVKISARSRYIAWIA